MAHITVSVEYGIHCLLYLVGSDGPGGVAASSRELAELQGVSPSFLAKIFPKLEKAGLVAASEGVRGGYKLARPAEEITYLDVYRAVEEGQLFALHHEQPNPDCSVGRNIQASLVCTMTRAQEALERELAAQTIADTLREVLG